jgi:hypothetical protein
VAQDSLICELKPFIVNSVIGQEAECIEKGEKVGAVEAKPSRM